MGTRSFIGIVNPDRTVSSVYCHWDGYPSNNGKILLENYNTAEKVNELIAFGHISSLGTGIGTKHDFDNRPADQCTFYNRDRSDEWESVKPSLYGTISDFLKSCDEEYTYLFDGEWLFREGNGPMQTLTIERCVDG